MKTGTVWGANPYYYQSGLCRAAVHAGAIGAEGGQIVVQPRKSAFYPAVLRNGVETRSTGGGAGFSISATTAGGRPGSPVFDAASSAGLTLDICPIDYGSFPEDSRLLTCGCSADTVKTAPSGRQSLLLSVGAMPCGAACRRIGAAAGKIEVKRKRRRSIRRFAQTAWRPVPRTRARVPCDAVPARAGCRRSATLGRSDRQPIQAPIAATLRRRDACSSTSTSQPTRPGRCHRANPSCRSFLPRFRATGRFV